MGGVAYMVQYKTIYEHTILEQKINIMDFDLV